ncbi:MAG: hypothetical protein RID02_01665 [Gracilimonas sp.]
MSIIVSCLLLSVINTVVAQRVSEAEASHETEISDLKLLDPVFNINIGYVEDHTKPGGGRYLCGGMTNSGAKIASRVVRNALSRVPTTARAKIDLKYVILCSRILANQQPIGGIPIPPLKLLMIDTKRNNEHIVLHELYHLIEFQFNTYNDPDWQQQFGASGYVNSYRGQLENSPMGSGREGFLNNYSKTFPHEERAELFAFLILNPRGVAAQLRRVDDEIVEQKIEFMIEKCRRLLGLNIRI